MAKLLTPPSSAVSVVQSRDGKSKMDFTPTWYKLFIDLIAIINRSGGIAGAVPATRLINTSSPLSGGGDLSGDRTLSWTPNGALGDVQTNGGSVTGISATIVTAKLTGGGANGSMTFVNGVLTAQVAAT